MKRTKCEQLLDMETVSVVFKNSRNDLSDQIISCFYTCYLPLFLKWAKITYQHHPADLIEFAARNAFTDGVLKFKEAAGLGKLYQSNAGVKTILFHYCRNLLLGQLTHEKRLAEKNKKLEPFFSNGGTYNAGEEEHDLRENRHDNIRKALEKMPPADRQIIVWRHMEGRSNDEIAGFLAITVASATNRIYRCMQRLRELVGEMQQNN